MLAWLKRLVAGLWSRRAKAGAAPPAAKKRRARQKDHYGAHYYLGDLLDRADEAFQDMVNLKRADPDIYDIFHRTGVAVCSSDALYTRDVEPFIAEALPSFGCAYVGHDKDKEDRVPARFIGFTKEERPINVQASNGATYRVMLTYTLDGHAYCGSFHVALKGSVAVPLKECIPTYHDLGRRGGVTRMQWRYPSALVDIAGNMDGDVEDAANTMFAVAAHASMHPESGLTVKISKGVTALKFAINVERTPYFFRDRERVVNHNGRTKRILHIVRTHTRKGKVINSHWRGLREFNWNGYSVKIGMGDKHFRNVSSFNLPAADPMTSERTVDAAHVGRVMARIEDKEVQKGPV
jgi:hypothetical protein